MLVHNNKINKINRQSLIGLLDVAYRGLSAIVCGMSEGWARCKAIGLRGISPLIVKWSTWVIAP